MKLYFAGIYTSLEGVDYSDNFLTSYVEFRGKGVKDKLKKLKGKKIFLDSGAFSAFTQGIKIDIDEYISFAKEYNSNFDVVATLDSIGDDEKTYRNYQYMKKQLESVLPVFHFNGDVSYLKKYIEQSKYIALGGLVPYAKQKNTLKNWLDYCFNIIPRDKKIHLFGITTQWVLERYPAYSCDSTGWLYAGKRGRVLEFKNGKIQTNDSILDYQKSREYTINNIETMKAYIELEKRITKLWEMRGIKWD